MSRGIGAINSAGDYFWIERNADVVGRGGFGQVYKGRNRNTGAFVAVKTCVFNDDFAHNHEIKLLRQFDSPYIIKYIDTQVVNDGSGRLAIIMELANTNLRDELNKIENYFGIPYRMLILLIAHLERGLSYLNERLIAHRDVKPANILICYSNNSPVFKLCDFGGSRIIESQSQPLNSICGTPGYLNEYLTANLALKSKALVYTKDECDLWALGCTIFECATGILPFLPAKGPMDTATMHKMMTNRPADAISGFTTEDGTIIWQKELPLDRCTYPKNFQRILCEFIRKLFDRRASTKLSFAMFSAMAVELTTLRIINLINVNTLSVEEFFDVSSAKYFERFNLDQYLRQISGSNSTSCLLFLPLGSTSVLHRTMHCVGRSNDIVSIGYWTDNATLKVDIHPSNHLNVSAITLENLLHSNRELKHAAANVLCLEKKIIEFGEFIQEVILFCRKFWITLSKTLECIVKDLNKAKLLLKAIALQSSVLGFCQRSNMERQAVINNAKQVENELLIIEEKLREIREMMAQLRSDIGNLDTIEISLPSFRKDFIENILRNKIIRSSSTILNSVENLLENADCRFIYNALRKAINLYEKTSSATEQIFKKRIEMVIRNIFDLPANLNKVKKQLAESMELIAVTHETNEHRFELILGQSNYSNNSSSNSTICNYELKDGKSNLKDTELKNLQLKNLDSNSAFYLNLQKTDSQLRNLLLETLNDALGKRREASDSMKETEKMLVELNRIFPLSK